MAQTTNTTNAAVIDEVWDLTVLQARYEGAVIMPRVLNKSDLVKRSGDIIHIPIKKRKVVGTVAADGGFTSDAQTLSQVDVVVNTWKYVSDETLDQTEAQSYWSPESDFPEDAGKALAEDYDTAIASLYADLTSNVVNTEADPKPVADDTILEAFLKLRKRQIPLKGLSFILPPEGWYRGLFKLERFTDADKSGQGKNTLISGARFQLFGVPGYESTLLQTPTGTSAIKGFLLHKETFAIAMQMNNKFKRADATAAGRLSSIVVMESLYGVKTVREEHSCLINIQAA